MLNEKQIAKMFKPCPCCGSNVKLHMNVPYGSGNYGSGANHIVKCLNNKCELMMKSRDTYYVSDAESDKAIIELSERWNNRCVSSNTMNYQIIPGEGVVN